MIMVWLMVAIGLFSGGVIYYYITPPVMEVLDLMVISGAPEGIISSISLCYHMGFVILFAGLILYGVIYSTRTEPDSYIQ